MEVTYGDCSDYGLGKFQKNIDQLAWEESLGGFAVEEVGSTEYNGHFALIGFSAAAMPTAAEIANYELTPTDLAFLAAQRAAVVETHPSGAVYVQWYDSADAANDEYAQRAHYYELPADWE